MNLLKKLVERLASRATKNVPLQKPPGGNFNVLEVAQLKAAFDSADYYESNLLKANQIDSALGLLTHAAK